MKQLYAFLFIFIIGAAVILRFWQIGTNPPSLTWDEVAWGYNAYSLGIDGRDEFGRFLPVDYLESFGDFKPPVYAYLDIIPVKLFGLSEFGTRFPSSFFGALTVVLTYFLTKEIFKKKESSVIALIAAGVLAISPWHILLSRAAFEANVATFFIVLGVYLFFLSFRKNRWFIILSLISFLASMYTFNTARVVTPLLMAGLVIGLRKEVFKYKKHFIVGLFIIFILFLPLAFFLLTPQAKLRFQEVNIFSDPGVVHQSNQEVKNDNNAWWSSILHNRRVIYSLSYLKHYFDNISPSFLFIKGDGNPKFSIQDVGQLYIWEIPFFLSGIFLLFKKRDGNWWIIPYWLLIGIIPAATARETPHALRTEVTLPTFQIITAYGVYYLLAGIKCKALGINIKHAAIGFFALLILFNFAYFAHNYFVFYPREFSGEWQFGYKEAVAYVLANKENYDDIYFTEELGRPYIYFLFYSQYDPKLFRNIQVTEREVFGFVHVKKFDKYHFEKDIGSILSNSQRALFIDVPKSVPSDAHKIHEFYLLNGEVALVAYTK